MNQLSNSFFKKNPLLRRSPAAIVYYRIRGGLDENMDEARLQMLGKTEYDRRQGLMLEERAAIEAITQADALVSMLRKPFDPANLTSLCDRAVALGQPAYDAMLARYLRSYQDTFLESAIYLWAKADPRYGRDLLDRYGELHNPYAQSLACLLFGILHFEDAQDLLLAEYERLLNRPQEPDLSQGPLLALYILHDQT